MHISEVSQWSTDLTGNHLESPGAMKGSRCFSRAQPVPPVQRSQSFILIRCIALVVAALMFTGQLYRMFPFIILSTGMMQINLWYYLLDRGHKS
jgi:hypothetical protein